MSVLFPGAAGNNVSTPDSNLLDADTAHLYQSLGKWQFSVQLPEPLAFAGFKASRTLSLGLNDLRTFNNVNAPVVPPDTLLSVAGTFASDISAGQDVIFRCTERDSSGALILNNDNVFLSPGPGNTIRPTFTFTTTAATTRLQISFLANSHIETDSTFECWDVMVAEGTDATFVPSLRIVGVLDETIDPPAMPIVFPGDGTPLTLGENWAGTGISYVRRDGLAGPIVAGITLDVPGMFPGQVIPDGTTITGDSGLRDWTFNGILRIGDPLGGKYPIEAFATYLTGVLPDGIHVYGHAADIGKLPAVVLTPGNPSIAVAAQGGPTFTLAWGVEATLVVNRSQPKYGTREIFDLWRRVADAAVMYEHTVTILTLEEVGEVEWSGGTAIAGTMPLVITVQET